jgi:hypothetical protein
MILILNLKAFDGHDHFDSWVTPVQRKLLYKTAPKGRCFCPFIRQTPWERCSDDCNLDIVLEQKLVRYRPNEIIGEEIRYELDLGDDNQH